MKSVAGAVKPRGMMVFPRYSAVFGPISIPKYRLTSGFTPVFAVSGREGPTFSIDELLNFKKYFLTTSPYTGNTDEYTLVRGLHGIEKGRNTGKYRVIPSEIRARLTVAKRLKANRIEYTTVQSNRRTT